METDNTSPEYRELTRIPESESGSTRRIGNYRLLQRIGEGGMGEVWEAEQDQPVRRKVALKLIKPGMDTKQVLARFEAERQALALMNHDNIARVFDAGATEQGRPYFAMEFVQGVPITEYCDTRRLTTPDRLGLFMQVCEGVQHAHQKGVIHRDLKPSNVLVRTQDDKAIPKIIDFGVAKATAQKLTERTMFTDLGVFVGTPEYMSPEQAEMSGLDVDTRTDVYSLGTLLYELLVGALPFETKDLRQVGFDEIRRRIREEEPSKPSTRLGTLGDRTRESTKRRGTDPLTLKRELSGDLDWITMKALEKDRTRRYGSPSELAADIGRYLTDQPVLATPPSTTYRARKFVRRHKIGVSAAAAGVLVLVAFAATMAVQRKRIATERDVAEQAQADLVSVVAFQAGMLGEVDAEQMGAWLAEDLRESLAEATRARGLSEPEVASFLESYDASMRRVNMTDTALDVIDRNILGRAVETLEGRFDDQPPVDARLRAAIGETYRKLGRYERSNPQLEAAFETRKRVLGDDHPDTLHSMNNLANLYRSQGRYTEAEPLYLEALETRERVLGDDHPDTLRSVHNLANLYRSQGRHAEAEPLYLETLETQKRVLGDDHPDTLHSMNNLANVYMSQGRYAEAEPLYLETIETKQRVLGDDHPDTLGSMNNLANVYMSQGRHAEAEPLYLETIETKQRVLGDDHPGTLGSMNNLANLYRSQGRHAEAEPLYLETIETQKRVLGNDHPDTLGSMSNLANVYMSQDRYAEAEPLYVETIETQKRVLGDDHPGTLLSMNNLAYLYSKQGRHGTAKELLGPVVALCEENLDTEIEACTACIHTFGELHLATGDLDEAELHLRRAIEIYEKRGVHEHLGVALNQLASISARRGDREKALEQRH